MGRQSELGEKLRALRQGEVEEEYLYALIHEFGNAGFEEAEEEVARFLTHSDPDLRYIAVNVLALHWGKAAYRPVFERMVFDDPDSNDRGIAARALGYLLRESRDKRATRLLIQKVRETDEDRYAIEAAYEALLDIWVPEKHRAEQSRRKYASGATNFGEGPAAPPNIDWGLVAAIERGELPPI